MILRDYQQAAHSAALNWIKYKSGVNGFVVAPGGCGKSILQAKLAEACIDMGKRVIMLARSEKLLKQNSAKLTYPHGIYCAGMGSKDLSQNITVASIQSIAHEEAADADIIICDEAHNIHQNPESETQYWDFFRRLGNPQIIGFTATAFRTSSGRLQWGEEIISIPIKPLIERGYLVGPINKCAATPDLSHLEIKIGEFDEEELEKIFTSPEQLTESVRKLKEYSHNRKSVLIFTVNRAHSEWLQIYMDRQGMLATCVDGKTPKDELSIILERFERGEIRYLINCNLLTEGYDAPQIDMVAILRATVSKGLFEQMTYRGTRPYLGKDNFLLLDMGGNLERHGPLGSPYFEKKKREKASKPKGRICPECETFVEENECADCGYVFPESERAKVNHHLSEDSSARTVYSQIEEYTVKSMKYKKHMSKAGKLSLRVDYMCNTKYGAISEWYSPHHESPFARGRALAFLKGRGALLLLPIMEYTLDQLIDMCEGLKAPKKIIVDHGEQFPRIKQYIWQE